MLFFACDNPMHNFSISKSSSATTTNATASTSTSASKVSQPELAAGQHQQGSFVGLSATVHTPESPLIPETYYQQDEPRLLSDTRLLSEINPARVDPFEILATHQTVTFEDQNQIQEQPDEFPLPFDELLQPVNDFDPMASENSDDVNLSILPGKNDERTSNRTTISICEQEILSRRALSRTVPEALLTATSGDPRLISDTLTKARRPDPTDEWIIVTGNKKKRFKCGYEGCGKSYPKKIDLQFHFFKHTGNSPYKCYMGTCAGKVSFGRQRALTRHIHVHHTFERPYQCEICEKRFRRSDHLKSHIGDVHNKNKKDSRYRCYMGGCTGEVAFCRRENLTRHIRTTHFTEKPFQCDICETRFGRKDNLLRHRRSVHFKQNEQKPPKPKKE